MILWPILFYLIVGIFVVSIGFAIKDYNGRGDFGADFLTTLLVITWPFYIVVIIISAVSYIVDKLADIFIEIKVKIHE